MSRKLKKYSLQTTLCRHCNTPASFRADYCKFSQIIVHLCSRTSSSAVSDPLKLRISSRLSGPEFESSYNKTCILGSHAQSLSNSAMFPPTDFMERRHARKRAGPYVTLTNRRPACRSVASCRILPSQQILPIARKVTASDLPHLSCSCG